VVQKAAGESSDGAQDKKRIKNQLSHGAQNKPDLHANTEFKDQFVSSEDQRSICII
jgi:hypothetical protein